MKLEILYREFFWQSPDDDSATDHPFILEVISKVMADGFEKDL